MIKYFMIAFRLMFLKLSPSLSSIAVFSHAQHSLAKILHSRAY